MITNYYLKFNIIFNTHDQERKNGRDSKKGGH